MTCSSCEALFERFLDDALRSRDRAALLAHIDGCRNCRSMLDELCAIDALLLEPRHIELAVDFTGTMMAAAERLSPPISPRAPIRAYLVSYVAAAWMLTGVGFLVAPRVMTALTGTVIQIARNAADALRGLGAVATHNLVHGNTLIGTLLGALVALDVALIVVFGVALKLVRPRFVERLRS